jgi:uncharacterized membrane protein
MALLEQTVQIRAQPEAVFDLIARVEDFCQYTEMIKDIRATAEDTYHWKVRAAGVSLEWDGVVVERDRPRRFAWKSINGVPNGGTYVLQAIPQGTLVSLSLEYHLPNRIVEKVIGRIADPLIRKVGAEVLHNVKVRLENGAPPPQVYPDE